MSEYLGVNRIFLYKKLRCVCLEGMFVHISMETAPAAFQMIL